MHEQDFIIPNQKKFGQIIKKETPETPLQNLEGKVVILTTYKHENTIEEELEEEQLLKRGYRTGSKLAAQQFRQYLYSENTTLYTQNSQSMNIYDIPQGYIQQINYNNKIFLVNGNKQKKFHDFEAFFEQKSIAIINISSEYTQNHIHMKFKQQTQFKFVQFGLKGNHLDQEDYISLQNINSDIYWMEKTIRRYQVNPSIEQYKTQAGQLLYKIIDQLKKEFDFILFSFDLDSINPIYFPGVSLPSVIGGFSDIESVEMIKIAANEEKIAILDISEYNPTVESRRSGVFLANIFYIFCEEYYK